MQGNHQLKLSAAQMASTYPRCQEFRSYARNWTKILQFRARSKIRDLFLFYFLKIFWPYSMACGIFVPPPPGIEPMPLALEAWSPNHWTAREFPRDLFIFKKFLKIYFIRSWNPCKGRVKILLFRGLEAPKWCSLYHFFFFFWPHCATCRILALPQRPLFKAGPLQRVH